MERDLEYVFEILDDSSSRYRDDWCEETYRTESRLSPWNDTGDILHLNHTNKIKKKKTTNKLRPKPIVELQRKPKKLKYHASPIGKDYNFQVSYYLWFC